MKPLARTGCLCLAGSQVSENRISLLPRIYILCLKYYNVHSQRNIVGYFWFELNGRQLRFFFCSAIPGIQLFFVLFLEINP